MEIQEILIQEKSLILLLIPDHHMTTVELNMTLKLDKVEGVQINLIMNDLLIPISMELQLKEVSWTFLLMLQSLTLGKESRFQTLQEKPTSFPTGNFKRAKTTCLSTTRTSLPSTLIREDKWQITRGRR